MRGRFGFHTMLGAAAIALCVTSGTIAIAQAPLGIDSARVTIAGTSNIHPYTASTTAVRIIRAELGEQAGAALENVLAPGAVAAFEVAIPAATLTSPREGLDANMHKALKVNEHAEIRFRLLRLDAKNAGDGSARAIGVLRVAGVEREIAMDITTRRSGSTLVVQGQFDVLMTDYGIAPPKAMLGMLKTDPKVTVTFEAHFNQRTSS